MFGGRFAYLYFLKHYGLNYVTAYDSCSSEGEPGLQRIAQVIQYMKKKDVRCLFHEEFVVPKVAQSTLNNIGTDYRWMGVLDVAQEYHYRTWTLSRFGATPVLTASPPLATKHIM